MNEKQHERITTYDYRDESGQLLYQVVRYDPKDFRQRRPDGNSGWIWDLQDVRRVLYRLPELLRASPVEWVYVVEGEKDVNRLCDEGLIATTCAMGAIKWDDSYSEFLNDRRVVIIPDNDEPGKKHANKIAKSLRNIGVKPKIIELPGLPEKGDVSDWFDNGGTKNKLLELIESASVSKYQPSSCGNSQLKNAKDERKSQSTMLVELADEAELFHDPGGDPFATIEIDGHLETWPIRSKGFRRWLAGYFWKEYHKAPSSQARQDALGVLMSKAIYEGAETIVNVRIGEHKGTIWLDLGDTDRQAIRITPSGWEIVSRSPVKFLRPRGLLALPRPIRGGSIIMLKQFLNLESDEDWTLVISWLIASFRPVGPYPILLVNGEQGSCKSTLCRILRAIVDPNTSPIRAEPRHARDLMIAASNSWFLALDNLSYIKPWLSDALCRLATGGGFATRELYSDGEEKIFDAKRPVIINGISELASRSDLLDRAICITLPTIRDDQRKTEAELWAEFNRQHPLILGALLDAISSAMNNLPSVKLQSPPRMADFATWAVAASEALGFTPEAFISAYDTNKEDVNNFAIEASPIGPAIQEFIDDQNSWEGTAKELIDKLEKDYCSERDKNRRDWPKSPQALGRALRRIAPNMRRNGIDANFDRGSGKKRKRLIHLERIDILTSEPSNLNQVVPKDNAISDMSDGSDKKILPDSCSETDSESEVRTDD